MRRLVTLLLASLLVSAALAASGVGVAQEPMPSTPTPSPVLSPPPAPCIQPDAVKQDIDKLEQEYLRTVERRIGLAEQVKRLADRESELRGALQALTHLRAE